MPQFEFDPLKHIYRIDGNIVPGVSEILEGARFKEPPSDHNREAFESAGKFGTAVHRACELYDLGTLKEEELDPELVPYLEAWKNFRIIYDAEIHDSDIEYQAYSPTYDYAGTLDRVLFIYGKLTLIDIKTSSVMPKWTGLQLAGYQIAYEEMTGEKIFQRWGVHLTEGKYKVYPFKDKTDKASFLSALNIYKWKKNNL